MRQHFQLLLKTVTKLKKNVESDSIGPQRKRIRTADYEQIDKAVYAWFISMREKKVEIDGPMLCAQALSFATTFKISDFKGSTGFQREIWNRPSFCLW